MELSAASLVDFSLSEIARLLNQSFEGYVVPARFDAASLSNLVRTTGIDLDASRVVKRGSDPAGIALISRRGEVSRLAGMAVMPQARGQGVGEWLMHRLVEESHDRGEKRMILEVIEQNPAAVRLYEKVGFKIDRRLLGFVSEEGEGEPSDGLETVDITKVARAALAEESETLPWQLGPASLLFHGEPNRGFRLGPAYAAISDPKNPLVIVRCLFVPTASRRQRYATRLMRALMGENPGKEWRMIPIWPENLAPGFWESLGFRQDSVSQFEMSRSVE